MLLLINFITKKRRNKVSVCFRTMALNVRQVDQQGQFICYRNMTFNSFLKFDEQIASILKTILLSLCLIARAKLFLSHHDLEKALKASIARVASVHFRIDFGLQRC